MRCLIDLRMLILAIVGLPAALGVFVSPAAVAEDQASSESPADVRVVREDLMNIMGSYERIFKRYKLDDELLGSLIEAEQLMESIPDEHLALVAEAIAPKVAKMARLVEELEMVLLTNTAARRTASAPGFPEANYPDFTFEGILGWGDENTEDLRRCVGGDNDGDTCDDDGDCPGGGSCDDPPEDPSDEVIGHICTKALNDQVDAEVRYLALSLVTLLEGVRDIAGRVCGQAFFGFTCSVCCIPTDILYLVGKFVHEAILTCGDLVSAAEIEGSFERLGHFHDDWTCKFPGDVAAADLRSGLGCNGIDDDCSGVIDDCGEDVFGPVVFIDQSVTKCCYDDAAEAAAAVALGVKAWDECGNVTVGAPVVNGTECDVTVDVTATDDCGNATTATTTVTIDGDGPTVTIDPAVADVCYASIDAAEQAVLDATMIDDNCDALEDLEISVHSSVTECALRVRVEVTDKCGNTTVAAITVRVDPHIPTVDIQVLRLGFRGEVLGFQTPVCYETIAEAEQAVLAVTYAEDNCTVSKELVTSVESAGDPCSLLVTTKAVDECGNENTDTETVRVDAEDPVVTCAVAIDSLSPPNHTMRNVGFTFTATDNCSGEPQIEIFITSDETTASADGAGQASPAPDAFILRDLDGVFQGILLRAERSTRGNGRVYEITVRATDECGNVGECSANVSVSPANGQPATDDGQFYDATAVN